VFDPNVWSHGIIYNGDTNAPPHPTRTQNKGDRAREIDRPEFKNKPKLLWGSIEKGLKKSWSHIIRGLHTSTMNNTTNIYLKLVGHAILLPPKISNMNPCAHFPK
jgi:hypothetical protein